MELKSRYSVDSGDNYIDHGITFPTLADAISAANKRVDWRFIYNQAKIIQAVCPRFIEFCKKVGNPIPKVGMIYRKVR